MEEITTEAPLELTEQQKSFFDWDTASPRINQLIDAWSGECQEAADRRNMRLIDVDPEEMRQRGQIQADETFIPVRVVDTNIAREDPIYIAYLTQSRRLVIFDEPGSPNDYTDRMEIEVTKGIKYRGWLTDFYRVRDGAALHG